ncbi:hypothetical protein BWK69_01340 [Candidatus Parcubacteria bacterium A4]|nr:MAG: hypothetical protein BWK69_01340 [Candidatus Parcubacteria bacterium A4]
MENQILDSGNQSQGAPMTAPQGVNASLPGAIAILGQAWSVYTRRLGALLGIMALLLLPAFIFPVVLVVLGLSMPLVVGDNSLILFGLTVSFVILFGVVYFFSQTWGQVALIYAIKDSGENIGVMESYRRAWRKIISYLWVIFFGNSHYPWGMFSFFCPGNNFFSLV